MALVRDDNDDTAPVPGVFNPAVQTGPTPKAEEINEIFGNSPHTASLSKTKRNTFEPPQQAALKDKDRTQLHRGDIFNRERNSDFLRDDAPVAGAVTGKIGSPHSLNADTRSAALSGSTGIATRSPRHPPNQSVRDALRAPFDTGGISHDLSKKITKNKTLSSPASLSGDVAGKIGHEYGDGTATGTGSYNGRSNRHGVHVESNKVFGNVTIADGGSENVAGSAGGRGDRTAAAGGVRKQPACAPFHTSTPLGFRDGETSSRKDIGSPSGVNTGGSPAGNRGGEQGFVDTSFGKVVVSNAVSQPKSPRSPQDARGASGPRLGFNGSPSTPSSQARSGKPAVSPKVTQSASPAAGSPGNLTGRHGAAQRYQSRSAPFATD